VVRGETKNSMADSRRWYKEQANVLLRQTAILYLFCFLIRVMGAMPAAPTMLFMVIRPFYYQQWLLLFSVLSG